MGGTADDEQVRPRNQVGRGVANGDHSNLILSLKPRTDPVGDDVRIAVHRFVDDECSHGSHLEVERL